MDARWVIDMSSAAAALLGLFVLKKLSFRLFAISAISLAILSGLLSVFYSGFSNLDASSASRRSAIAAAVCDPPKNSTVETRDVSCGSTDTADGLVLEIVSVRVLSPQEIDLFIERLTKLKPLLTAKGLQVDFKQRTTLVGSVSAGGDGRENAIYKYARYRTVLL